MTNEEIKQRIQYLVEHGGVWDDPIADLRRHIAVCRSNRALGRTQRRINPAEPVRGYCDGDNCCAGRDVFSIGLA